MSARAFALAILLTAALTVSALATHLALPAPVRRLAGAVPTPLRLPTALREGDLVFRQGRDAVSGAVLALDPKPQYSHVGILVRRSGKWMVIHSLPADAPADVDGVRMETLASYLSPPNAQSTAFYRVHGHRGTGQVSARQAVAAALALHASHARFDSDFDFRDGRRVYCTELVWRAFRAAGIDLAPRPEWLELPFRSGFYILPSTLIRSGALVPVD